MALLDAGCAFLRRAHGSSARVRAGPRCRGAELLLAHGVGLQGDRRGPQCRRGVAIKGILWQHHTCPRVRRRPLYLSRQSGDSEAFDAVFVDVDALDCDTLGAPPQQLYSSEVVLALARISSIVITNVLGAGDGID